MSDFVVDYMVQALEPILPPERLLHLREKENPAIHLFDALLGSYLDLQAKPLISYEAYYTILLREQNMHQTYYVIDSLYQKFMEYKETNDQTSKQLKEKVQRKNELLKYQDEQIFQLKTENNTLLNEINSNKFTVQRLTEENQQIGILYYDNSLIQQSVNDMSRQAEELEKKATKANLEAQNAKTENRELYAKLRKLYSDVEIREKLLSDQLKHVESENKMLNEEVFMHKTHIYELENDAQLGVAQIKDISKELEQNYAINQLYDEISALKQDKIALEDQAIQYTTNIGQLILEANELRERAEALQAQKGDALKELYDAKQQLSATQKMVKEQSAEIQKLKQSNQHADHAQKEAQRLGAENAKTQAELRQILQEQEYLQKYYYQVILENKNLTRKLEEFHYNQANQIEGNYELYRCLCAVLSAYLRQAECILEAGVLSPSKLREVVEEYIDYCQDFSDLLGILQLVKMDSCTSVIKQLITLFSESNATKTMLLSQTGAMTKTYKIEVEEGQVIDMQM